MPSDTHDVKSGDIPPVFFTEAYHPVRTTPSPDATSLEARCLPCLLCAFHAMSGAFNGRHEVYNPRIGRRDLSPYPVGISTRTMAGTRHYGWVIFSLSVTNLLVEGGIKNTVPVVYVALRDSFHWSAAATAGIFSLGGLSGALCAPLLGRLLDRMGPRYLFPLGGLLILMGYLTSSCATELWQLYLFYSILATVGENSISSFTIAATLSPWFPYNRGRMLGLADAGNSLGQVVFLPLAQLLISTIGWRDTFRIFGLLFFLLVGPANFLLQRRPAVQLTSPRRRRPLPTGPASSQMAAPDAPQMRSILRYLPVWFLVIARLLATMGNHLTQVHMVAFFITAGYNPMLAASAIGAVGLVGMVGRPLSGTLSDVLGREVVYTVGSGMQIGGIVALLALGDGQSLWPMILFVALNGLSDGIGGLVVGAKAADLFPSRALGSVMGLVQMGRGLGILVGPLLGGLLFDLQGNYGVAFLLAVALVCVAIGCMWGARLTGGQAND
jgi:MFS family permease